VHANDLPEMLQVVIVRDSYHTGVRIVSFTTELIIQASYIDPLIRLAFLKRDIVNIGEVFHARKIMHVQMYYHVATIGIALMLNDIIKYSEKQLGVDRILTLEPGWEDLYRTFTDQILYCTPEIGTKYSKQQFIT